MNSSPFNALSTRVVLLAANLVVLGLCAGGFVQVRDKPSLGVELRNASGHVIIAGVDEETVPELRSRARVGDTIAAVDGFRARTITAFETTIDAHRIGETVRLTLARSGAGLVIDATVRENYGSTYLVIIVVVAAVFWSLGLFVLLKRPEEASALTFHLAMNCVAVMLMATAGCHVVAPYGLGHIVRVGDLYAYAFMTALFFHFTLQFPTPKLLVVATTTSVAFLLATLGASPRWLEAFGELFEICQKFFIALGLISVASFVHSYRSAVEVAERMKLRWVLTGVTVGFLSFIGLQLLPQALGLPPLVREEWIVLLAGVAPVTFAIAIVRYRVMDVDVLLSRSTVYMILLGTLALVYTGLVYGLGALARSISGTMSDAVPIIATLAIALVFEPARERVQHFVDRRFFRARYSLRQAQRTLADELAGAAEPGRLAAIAIAIVDGILNPERIALATIRGDGGVTLLAGRAIAEAGSMNGAITALGHLGPRSIRASERWIEPGVEVSGDGMVELEELGFCCVLAAPFNDGYRALILVGAKKAGTRYSIEDLDLLRAAITNTSLGLERIMLQTNILRREAEAEQLRELSRLKSYFVSSVSHELKTPLTSIRMFAEMLQGAKSGDRQRVERYAQIIESESKRLTRLIDNVLDFAKIERGAKEYRFASVDLTQLVDGALEALEHQLASAGFAIERVSDPEPLELEADPDAIVSAIVNLVSNAIRYSDTTREIAVRTFRRNGCAAVAVADKGIGLSEEERAHIFDPFFRTESARQHENSGAGLGLALIRHVVEAHGGTIELESARGVGSTFTLLFPLTINEPETTRHEEHTADRG